MSLCRMSSSVSCETSIETCGEKARKITSRISVPLPTFLKRPDSAGDGLLTVDPEGENTDPLMRVLAETGGVTVPESAGESGLA